MAGYLADATLPNVLELYRSFFMFASGIVPSIHQTISNEKLAVFQLGKRTISIGSQLVKY
jgi:hypothetical protein